MPATHHTVRTEVLNIAYEESGPKDALPAILLHGFPYDPRCYDAVAPRVAAAGFRAIVPYLRGYGPTRFLSKDTPRSGQQAALAHDLLQLMDALKIGDGGRRRLRLGRPRRLHRLRAVAGAGQRARHLLRL